jgi:hypothetical protein
MSLSVNLMVTPSELGESTAEAAWSSITKDIYAVLRLGGVTVHTAFGTDPRLLVAALLRLADDLADALDTVQADEVAS